MSKHMPPAAKHILATDEPKPSTHPVQDAEWEDPLPLGWRTDLPPFPVDELPPVLSRYVRAISDEIQTPYDLAGTVSLGVLAASIGGAVRVRVRSGWIEPTNLYVVPVADPASRKSAVVAACRAPLGKAEQELRDECGPEVVDARTGREVLDQRAARLVSTAAKSGTPVDLAAAQDAVRAAEQVVARPWPRLATADATPEALVTLLAEQGGRIAAISAEAGVFDSLGGGRYTQAANIEALLLAHAGDEILVDRRGRPPERIEHPALTLVASIQPYALRKLLAREDFAGRGLLARVLWSLTPDVVGTRKWEAPEAPEAVKTAYRTLITDLAVRTHRQRQATDLTLTPAAYKVLGEYYDKIEQLMAPGGENGSGLIRGWAGKLAGAVSRIAGCLHVARFGETLLECPQIDDDTMRAAVNLGEYYRAHADVALGASEDPRTTSARILLDALLRRETTTFTMRELLRGGPKSLRQAAALAPVVEYLGTLGWVRHTPDSTPRVYTVRPDATEWLERLERATRATGATDDEQPDVSAGQGPSDPEGPLSPPWATVGDTTGNANGAERQPSPRVAQGGDSIGELSKAPPPAETSSRGAPVAPVAPVALSGYDSAGCRVCRESLDPTLDAKWHGRQVHPRCVA